MEKKSKLSFQFKDGERSNLVAGVDEAGRGCLLGPVYAAAVVWDDAKQDGLAQAIKDSKKLSAKKRAELACYIENNALAYGVGFVDANEIDQINILNASFKAMHKALDQVMETLPSLEHIYVDGDKFKTYMSIGGDFIPHSCIVDGDNTYVAIAAASILAKVYHDKWISDLLQKDEGMHKYGISTNQGYGSKQHMVAIKEHGVSAYHRKSYKCCH